MFLAYLNLLLGLCNPVFDFETCGQNQANINQFITLNMYKLSLFSLCISSSLLYRRHDNIFSNYINLKEDKYKIYLNVRLKNFRDRNINITMETISDKI